MTNRQKIKKGRGQILSQHCISPQSLKKDGDNMTAASLILSLIELYNFLIGQQDEENAKIPERA